MPQADTRWNSNGGEYGLTNRQDAGEIHGMKTNPTFMERHFLSSGMVSISLQECDGRFDLFQGLPPFSAKHEVPGNKITMHLTKHAYVLIEVALLKHNCKAIGPDPMRIGVPG